MESKNNVFSNITMDYCCSPSIRQGVIRGIEASIFYDLIKRQIRVVSKDGKQLLSLVRRCNMKK